MIRVMVVDDLKYARKGLARIIANDPGLDVIAQAENGQDAINQLKNLAACAGAMPDVILMDVRMPVMDGVKATRIISREFPHSHILILTTYDQDDYAFGAIEAGAYGFLLKDVTARELQNAVKAVAHNDAVLTPRITRQLVERERRNRRQQAASPAARELLDRLTPREREIASLIADGLTNQEIADTLTIEPASVRRYVSRIFSKTALTDRTQIVITWYCAQHGEKC